MAESGVTQAQLAEILEMTQGGVQHWLAGSRQPSLEDINRIAEILKVAPAWLTHGLEPHDMLDGIADPARSILQRLIKAERAGALAENLWKTIQSVVDLSLPATDTAPSAVPGIAGKVLAQKLSVETNEIQSRSVKA
jgi:transcriptional regulator with XRE-family HTH domain